MIHFKNWLLGLPRRQKRFIQVVTDVLLVWLSLWLAFIVRLGIEDMYNPILTHRWLFVAAPLIAIPLFIRIGMYRAVLRYFGNDALLAIIKAVTLSSLVLGVVVFWYSNHQSIVPRSIIFNYWWLSMVIIGGARLFVRHYLMGDWLATMGRTTYGKQDDGLRKVAIYGAGSAGNQLLAALRAGRSLRPVAFVDDDQSITDRVISGLQVFRPKQIQRMVDETGAQEILLALPSTSRARKKEILELLEGFPLHVRSIPNLNDLASGRVRVDDIREVEVADLLGRDLVPAQADLLESCIKHRVVMVTGAGGSIGAELCRQIMALHPKLLLMFDHSEFNLYNINSELDQHRQQRSLPVKLLPILGTVREQSKLLEVMTTWNVDTVYHAAAYKHVPIVEHNVSEGVRNNVLGTLYCAQSALRAGVSDFVLVSTDKAVRPTNVMGSTKRLSEMILQALSNEVAPVLFGDPANVARVNKTRFTMVRFGNVLGSSGSVIPLFYKQIKAGGPITVTHPNITRYFMTIPEAAQLVIQAGSMGQGGDVFVLDMGEPVEILKLAEKLIHLSGLSIRSERNPQGDIGIEFSGLRPGEKLYEELLIGECVESTRHPMIMSAHEDYLSWEVLRGRLTELMEAVTRDDYPRVRQLLRDTVAGYTPQGEIVDWIHQQQRKDQ